MARVYEAARGNPLFSLEIALALHDSEPALGRPLPVPGGIRDVLRERIERLSANARDVVLTVSAMARPTLHALRIADPRPSTTESGLVEAAEAGVLAVEDEQVGFVHPLLGSTVYWSAPRARRQAVHARLSEVVSDPEERARHIALMGTDAIRVGRWSSRRQPSMRAGEEHLSRPRNYGSSRLSSPHEMTNRGSAAVRDPLLSSDSMRVMSAVPGRCWRL